MNQNEVEIEIGMIEKQIVLHIHYGNPDLSPVLIGLSDETLASLIEGLQQAQQQVKEMPDE